ncbi:hypothetical protein MCC93_23420 [Morococcus cerebrosus]|uniref:Uncharacterized protein n=1 Tax=Morococcus cerebrosus TaxID=1056807 RepID=A0A0C1E3A1_9NEIS|nr:hypothetical protein MCC93_23420 [Morococcus cerebrosus]
MGVEILVFRGLIAPSAERSSENKFSDDLLYIMRPLQKNPSPDSRNPNTGFRLFPLLIAPDFTQISP